MKSRVETSGGSLQRVKTTSHGHLDEREYEDQHEHKHRLQHQHHHVPSGQLTMERGERGEWQVLADLGVNGQYKQSTQQRCNKLTPQ